MNALTRLSISLFILLFVFDLPAQTAAPQAAGLRQAFDCNQFPDLGPDILLCHDSTVVLNAGPGFISYVWSDGSTGQTLAVSQPDVYWVEVLDTCGSIQRDSLRLSFSLLSDTKFPDSSICAGEWVYYSVPGFDTYAWAPSTGLSCTNCADVLIQPGVTTQYTLLASNNAGCVLRDTFVVAIRPLPTRSDTLWFCPGDSILLDGNVYTSAGVVQVKISVPGACDTLADYHLLKLPQPKRTETVPLLAGGSVTLQGMVFTQPDTVQFIAPASGVGCDTLITYIIELIHVDTCPYTATFLKQYQEATSTSGFNLCPSADGNTYVTGRELTEGAILMKIAPSGHVLWSRRILETTALRVYISELIEDSDGMLVACGQLLGNIPQGCIFRYDPAANTILWSKVMSPYNYEPATIQEIASGGNYRMTATLSVNPDTSVAEIWELERGSGLVAGGTVKSYGQPGRVGFGTLIPDQNAWYVYGGYEGRGALSKVDAASGVPLWSRVIGTGASGQDKISGGDMILDGGVLVCLSDSNFFPKGSFFLHKHTLDGELLWMKRYEWPNSELEDVIAVPDGYVILGQQLSTDPAHLFQGQMFVLKTDKNGVPMWAKRLPNADFIEAVGESGQKQVLLQCDHLLITTTLRHGSLNSDMAVLRLDMNGNAGDGCQALESIVIPASDVPNPLNQVVQIPVSTHGRVTLPLPLTVEAIQLTERPECVGCGQPDSPAMTIDTLRFCPGDTVLVAGQSYSQPVVVVSNLPASIPGGCDTMATHVLQFIPLPQSSTVGVQCPTNITVQAAPNATSVVVNYSTPVGFTDCPCGDAVPERIQGLPVGADFPVGSTLVCYQAADACGNAQSCCFSVTVEKQPFAEQPCDVKTTACIRFELLGIVQNAARQKTYRIRLTNTCADPLAYAYVQVPDGLKAVQPADQSTYVSPDARAYQVRNPNYSPFYSLRFKPAAAGLANGQTEFFQYVLPPQASADYIHVAVRLASGAYVETYLNTFNCPVATTPIKNPAPVANRNATAFLPVLRVFPNPVAGSGEIRIGGGLFADARFLLLDLTGKVLLDSWILDNRVASLPTGMAAGLYYFRIVENGRLAGSGKLIVLDR